MRAKPFPGQLNRLMRDGGVQNPFDFIDAQLKFYPNYVPAWTPQEYESPRARAASIYGVEEQFHCYDWASASWVKQACSLSDWAYMA